MTEHTLLHKLQLLNTMTAALCHATHRNEVFAVAANMIPKLITTEHCTVALVRVNPRRLELFALEHTLQELLTQTTEFAQTLLARTSNTHTLLNITENPPPGSFDAYLLKGGQSFLSAPMFDAGDFIGTLNFSHTNPDSYNVDDALWIRQIASVLAVHLARWRFQSKLRKVLSATLVHAQELKGAKEAAEVAIHTKGTFLANMSHELRTPLNAILGFTQLMLRDSDTTPAMRESLDVIENSGGHLLGLINNILEMSRIEAGLTEVNAQNFDLYGFLDDIEDLFLTRAITKGLQFAIVHANAPRYVHADRRKLRQILLNLIGNALKFTTVGCVTLNVTLRGGRIAFRVEDTGPGIPPEALEQIFQAFAQTETGENAQEGSGLGLSICREFVELLGGELRVDSQFGQGSAFMFDIPFEEGDPDLVPDEKPDRFVTRIAPDQEEYRILVVEDKWTNRRFLVKILESVGFQVREAENGKEGIRVFQEWEPHLIWMDMRMPVMSGYEASKAIKTTTQGQATIVIALTASVLEEERAIVLSAGCDDFLRKPVRQQELFEAMQRNLGVEFIWAESNSEGFQVETSSAPDLSLVGLDRTLLDALTDAAAMADGELVEALLEQLPAGWGSTRAGLMVKVRDFLFHEIIEMVDTAKAQGEHAQ